MRMRGKPGAIDDDRVFASAYPVRGRPAQSP